MKRLTALFLSLAMMLALAACGNDTGSDTSGSPSGGNESPAQSPAETTPAAPVTGEPQYGGEVTLYYPKFYNYFDPSMTR